MRLMTITEWKTEPNIHSGCNYTPENLTTPIINALAAHTIIMRDTEHISDRTSIVMV